MSAPTAPLAALPATLWLAHAATAPAPDEVQSAAAVFSPSEQARLARITRPARRAQFIAGHLLLRALLQSLGVAAPVIEVAADGRPLAQDADGRGVGVSLAHSGGWVAALAGGEGVPGVDIELSRDAPADPQWPAGRPPRLIAADELDRWVVAEARAKSLPRHASCWVSRWECAPDDGAAGAAGVLHVAVAMSSIRPAVRLVNLQDASYNPRELVLAWRPATY